jgi:hypothetical protein
MQPLTILTGVVLGSAAATTFALGATLVVFLVLAGEHPQFKAELPLLAVYSVVFGVLTALAAVSFVAEIHRRRWRVWSQLLMWLALCGVAALYWSTRY